MFLKKVIDILEKLNKTSCILYNGIVKIILYYDDDITFTIKDGKFKEEPLSDLQRDLMALMKAKRILCNEYKFDYSKGINKAIRAIEDKILAKDNPVE